jgi:hypothetical protein
MKWNSKKWLIAIGAIVLLLLIYLVFRQTPVTVEAGVVKRGEMLVTIDGEGKTRVREKYTVTAPVSGKMSRFRLKEGDSVFRDYVITTIDPSPPERPLAPSRTENFPDIYGVKVYAPASGRILRVIEKDERMVQAGTPILEIGNPENLEIVVDLLSSEATQIRPGSKMLIENWGGADTLHARVRMVEPQAFTKVSALGVEEQRVNVIADLLDKVVKLGDNYRLDMRIIAWQGDNALKAPSSAFFREGEKWKVFVVEGGRARQREIEVGYQNASESEILNGLSEGELVVLHPPNQLADGTPIEIQ